MEVDDVLPRRNLPPESENWGRQLENRAKKALGDSYGLKEFVGANYRSAKESLNSLSRQITYSSSWGGSLQTIDLPLDMRDTYPYTPVYLGSMRGVAPPTATSVTVTAIPASVSGIIYNPAYGPGENYGLDIYAYLNPGIPPEEVDTESIYDYGYSPLGERVVEVGSYYHVSSLGWLSGNITGTVNSSSPTIDFWVSRDTAHRVFELDVRWSFLVQWT